MLFFLMAFAILVWLVSWGCSSANEFTPAPPIVAPAAKQKERNKTLSIKESDVWQRENNIQQRELINKGQEEKLNELKASVLQLSKEKQQGFPLLAKAYDKLFKFEEVYDAQCLETKKHPAHSAAETVKKHSGLRRQAEHDKQVAQNLVEYYENIAPFLIDLKEEVIDDTVERETIKEYSSEEREDYTTKYVSKSEYRLLSSTERNQRALERFWSRPKSKFMIGRIYERYVGYLYEASGYDVEYAGIFKGFEDLGRDLICKKGNETVIIQCKHWAKWRTIFEKHIFQFFGTIFQYKDEHPKEKVTAVFYTTTELSPLAKRFAKELNIKVKENFKFDETYACIKCHTSKNTTDTAKTGTKIYHLPFDQQYDKVKIEKKYGEFYAKTVEEAEAAGFRRAFRYAGCAEASTARP